MKVEGVCPLLWVFDMPKAIAFYRDLLGFEVVSTDRVTSVAGRSSS
jgi:uncharacterized glyoxalase superfamily protein PhnB